jgi:hypothetical protein
MPRTVFTPQGIETMRKMAENGDPARDIALAIGSTPASVRVKCCQLKIKLSRVRRPSDLMFTIPPEEFHKLVVAAERYGCTPTILTRKIVTLVLRDNLVDGVLDEEVGDVQK